MKIMSVNIKQTQICNCCEKDLPVEDFGWRYMYQQRLTHCKKCRNKQAKLDKQLKQFKSFNKLSVMKWGMK